MNGTAKVAIGVLTALAISLSLAAASIAQTTDPATSGGTRPDAESAASEPSGSVRLISRDAGPADDLGKERTGIAPKSVQCPKRGTRNGYAWARCYVDGGSQVRVRADCKRWFDRYSRWEGRKGTWYLRTGACPFGIRGSIIETSR